MLKAFSGKDRQHAQQIMQVCINEGMTLEQCLGYVARFNPNAGTECPSCGEQGFGRVATMEGMKRNGCRKCLYTEVVG